MQNRHLFQKCMLLLIISYIPVFSCIGSFLASRGVRKRLLPKFPFVLISRYFKYLILFLQIKLALWQSSFSTEIYCFFSEFVCIYF